jgi:hypothetical protein
MSFICFHQPPLDDLDSYLRKLEYVEPSNLGNTTTMLDSTVVDEITT